MSESTDKVRSTAKYRKFLTARPIIDLISSGCKWIPPLLALMFFALPAQAQDIISLPVAKMEPGMCPGQCIQILVRNQTQQSLALKLRNPGGNWQTFTLPSRTGLKFRCYVCSGRMEAMLPDDDDSSLIGPGKDYDIRYIGTQQIPKLVPVG